MTKLTEEEKRIRHRDCEKIRRAKKRDEINSMARERYQIDPEYKAKKKSKANLRYEKKGDEIRKVAAEYRATHQEQIKTYQGSERMKEYHRDWMRRDYEQNPEKYSDLNHEQYEAFKDDICQDKRMQSFDTKVECVAYLGGVCTACGREGHPVVMQFHHRNPENKLFTIASKLSNGWNLDRLKDELDKCDLVCANCHQYIHWSKNNSDLLT